FCESISLISFMSSPSRRSFIRQVSNGMIGAWALSAVPENTFARYIISRDEAVEHGDESFWKVVRDQFPLTHDRIYLNNGTIGPSPYVVLESVKHAMEDLDMRGEYDGWETARPKIAKFVSADV